MGGSRRALCNSPSRDLPGSGLSGIFLASQIPFPRSFNAPSGQAFVTRAQNPEFPEGAPQGMEPQNPFLSVSSQNPSKQLQFLLISLDLGGLEVPFPSLCGSFLGGEGSEHLRGPKASSSSFSPSNRCFFSPWKCWGSHSSVWDEFCSSSSSRASAAFGFSSFSSLFSFNWMRPTPMAAGLQNQRFP